MKDQVKNLLNKEFEGSSYFLVEVNVSDEHQFIEVLVDGDEGIDVDKCSELTRFLNNALVEENSEAENYSLSVSSPGLDNPLKLKRQYNKNVGRKLVVNTKNEEFEGKLVYLDEEKIFLKGQKLGVNGKEIFFKDIKEAKVKI